ncbi:hypothetical protein QR680_005054 [Steinernema hermaphroditum]|uniref:Major facilitator superfamily (MFS) profile domain-containing protein n=1 Tax=Steinernema hermaphroditum TaxID=289476 RepID=A0AA39HQP9_9BILA|nr:hypothetical protein QR680_005054 [Steinernema hermaphroditum]
METLLRKSGRSARGLRNQLACLLFIGFALISTSQFLFYVLYHPIVTLCSESGHGHITLFGNLGFEIDLFCDSLYTKFFIQITYFAAMACALFCGRSAPDRFGSKDVLVVSLSAAGIFSLLLSVVPFFWTFLALNAVLGLFHGLTLGAAVHLLLAWSCRKIHPFVLHNLFGSEFLGTVGAAVFIYYGDVSQAAGWRFPLLANGLLVGIVARNPSRQVYCCFREELHLAAADAWSDNLLLPGADLKELFSATPAALPGAHLCALRNAPVSENIGDQGGLSRSAKETPEFLRKKARFEKAEKFCSDLARANGLFRIPFLEAPKAAPTDKSSWLWVLETIVLAFVSVSAFVFSHFPTELGLSWPGELLLLSGCQLLAYLVVLPFVAYGGRRLRLWMTFGGGLVTAVLLLVVLFWTDKALAVAKAFVCLQWLLALPQIASGPSTHSVLLSLGVATASRTFGVWLVTEIVAYRRAICVFGVASFAFQSIAAGLAAFKTESRAVDTGSPAAELLSAASTKTIDVDYASNLSVDLNV